MHWKKVCSIIKMNSIPSAKAVAFAYVYAVYRRTWTKA
jgi:hypothetical protein